VKFDEYFIGSPVCGYAVVSANLVPSDGLNSSTTLWITWESERLREITMKENPSR
jgi:hypothetical protein